MKKSKIFSWLLSIITLLALAVVGSYFIFDLEQSLAFPLMFFLMGLQQLVYGFYDHPRRTPKQRHFSLGMGLVIIAFDLFIVIPTYLG